MGWNVFSRAFTPFKTGITFRSIGMRNGRGIFELAVTSAFEICVELMEVHLLFLCKFFDLRSFASHVVDFAVSNESCI